MWKTENFKNIVQAKQNISADHILPDDGGGASFALENKVQNIHAACKASHPGSHLAYSL